jgi:hypothetical protein
MSWPGRRIQLSYAMNTDGATGYFLRTSTPGESRENAFRQHLAISREFSEVGR